MTLSSIQSVAFTEGGNLRHGSRVQLDRRRLQDVNLGESVRDVNER